MANSTDLGCNTFEPREASSKISSYVIESILDNIVHHILEIIYAFFQSLYHVGFFVSRIFPLFAMSNVLEIHEIIIHRRLPPPSKTKSKYIKAIRKAHKIHHKNRNKDHCVNFGMLIVPFKYFK